MPVSDPLAQERWRTTFAAWRTCGLSVAAFCRSRHLNLSSFYRWRKILDNLDRLAATRPYPATLESSWPRPHRYSLAEGSGRLQETGDHHEVVVTDAVALGSASPLDFSDRFAIVLSHGRVGGDVPGDRPFCSVRATVRRPS